MTFPMLLASLILLGDPLGDANGNGSLIPPTAAAIETVGGFDLELVKVVPGETLGFELHLASPPNQLALIEVYLDTQKGGLNATLPGSSMRLPKNTGWEHAFRVTTAGASSYTISKPNMVLTPDLTYHQLPLNVERSGRVLTFRTDIAPSENIEVFATVGLLDQFGPTPWKPLTAEPSPWSFSSKSQTIPVIDLLAPTFRAQQTAINRQVFPNRTAQFGLWPWLALMITGLILAFIGIFFRLFIPHLDKLNPAEQDYQPTDSQPNADSTLFPTTSPDLSHTNDETTAGSSFLGSYETDGEQSGFYKQSFVNKPEVSPSGNGDLSLDLPDNKIDSSHNPPEYSIKPREKQPINNPTNKKQDCEKPNGVD
ncbi:MAG: hypothetical protein MKZ59_06655 [Deinococcales bacterium]|nr:hypothetical protein [Deinococcales bacterium]